MRAEIRKLTDVYNLITREASLPARMERTEAVMPADLTENGKNATIAAQENAVGDGVNFVCNIDNKIYSCIAGDLQTTEVIVTDKQIEHSNRHQDAYEEYKSYIPTVLAAPDVILEDTRPNTGLVFKEIKGEEPDSLLIVLRIKVAQDPDGFKNSIINCWKIGQKRYEGYKRNRRCLYKSR